MLNMLLKLYADMVYSFHSCPNDLFGRLYKLSPRTLITLAQGDKSELAVSLQAMDISISGELLQACALTALAYPLPEIMGLKHAGDFARTAVKLHGLPSEIKVTVGYSDPDLGDVVSIKVPVGVQDILDARAPKELMVAIETVNRLKNEVYHRYEETDLEPEANFGLRAA